MPDLVPGGRFAQIPFSFIKGPSMMFRTKNSRATYLTCRFPFNMMDIFECVILSPICRPILGESLGSHIETAVGLPGKH